MEQYEKIQQLLKKEPGTKERVPIFPPTVIQAVFDGKTGASLEAILAQFNSVFVQFQGTAKDTRILIPAEMRRPGLIITYVNAEGETVSERASLHGQADDEHWALDVNWSRIDVNWSRIDELSLSGDIAVSARGTWIINGADTGIKAVGPKGENGITPWLKEIDNKLHYSYDNVKWTPCSDPLSAQFRNHNNRIQISYDKGKTWTDISDPVATYVRFAATSSTGQDGSIGKLQYSHDKATWHDLSPEFRNYLRIQGYVATHGELPTGVPVGTIYGVGPFYEAGDTTNTNPMYQLRVWDGSQWVNNGTFTSISAGIVQETGDSETEVMSQKAVSEKLSELGGELVNIQETIIGRYKIKGSEPSFTWSIPIYINTDDLIIWLKDENDTITRVSTLKAVYNNGTETVIKDSISPNAEVVIPNPKNVAKITMYIGSSFLTGNEGVLKLYAKTSESLKNEIGKKTDKETSDSEHTVYFATGASPSFTKSSDSIIIKFPDSNFRIYNKGGQTVVDTVDYAGMSFTLNNLEQLVFNSIDKTISVIKISNANEGNYIQLLAYLKKAVKGIMSPYYVEKYITKTDNQEIAIGDINENLAGLDYRLDAVSDQIETEYYTSKNGDGYSNKIIPIRKGNSYSIYFTIDKAIVNEASSDDVADGYFNLKIVDTESMSTLWKIASVTKTQVGETFILSFTSDKDVDCKVGSASRKMSDGFNMAVKIVRISAKNTDATDIVSYYNSNYVKEKENLRRWSDFKCFFFSDIHASELNFKRIIELANNYGSGNVQCIINTGDTTSSIMNEGLDWYNNLVNKSNTPILHSPGNHDVWKDSTWSWASGVDIYDFIIKKVVESVDGIVLPSNAATEGKCYYYKDFGYVRVISLLSISTSTRDYYFDDTQKAWLTSVLESARTTYHYWKIVGQKPIAYTKQSGDVIKEVLTCDADLNKYNYEYYKDGDIYAVPMSVIIMNHVPFKADKAVRIESNKLHSWDDYRKDTFAKSLLSDRMFVSEEAVDIVANYIENGGSFICWLTGHTHADSVLTHSDHPKQMMININSAKYSNKDDGVAATSSADAKYDSFDYIGVDLKSGMIKVLRIGWAEDSAMRVRRSWCYDYANGNLMSEN